MDKSRLIAFVLRCIRDHAILNAVDGEPPSRRMEFSLSQFRPLTESFGVSVEFSVPTAGGMAVGTCETILHVSGDMEHIRTVGVVFGE